MQYADCCRDCTLNGECLLQDDDSVEECEEYKEDEYNKLTPKKMIEKIKHVQKDNVIGVGVRHTDKNDNAIAEADKYYKMLPEFKHANESEVVGVQKEDYFITIVKYIT